jgi:predicted Zn-dependent peptidase
MVDTVHEFLDCGVELGAQVIGDRRTVSVELRLHAGVVDEPEDKLGLTHIVEETITKGTAERDGRALSDAFDEIGVPHSSWAGKQSFGFACTALPEFADRALELHAEFLTRPTFDEEACRVAVELAQQELRSLEDEPRELCDKLLARQAYGPALGRHVLGEPETLARITREDVHAYWQRFFAAGRLTIALAGPVDVGHVRSMLNGLFEGLGSAERAGRDALPVPFAAARRHHARDLEQTQIALCWPGVPVTDEEYPVQRVVLGILSGGMSSRLFTEVREKLGLVYSIEAWAEHPRGAGMIHVAASTTPERCGETYRTILGELERLAKDVTEEELERAVAGLVARTETRGDMTSARCRELVSDLSHYGRPVPLEEKIAALRAVTVEDVRRYLHAHPRDRLSVITLGPQDLDEAPPEG